ncbi:MAG: ferrous iron transport protein B, partial [Planctomycetota bacterium]
MSNKTITVALAGNPNSGKTTIFNALTGAKQHVGNYPGVTVERKEGSRTYKGYTIHFVDLPGTYSLTAHSVEEVVARDYIITDHPDVVVDIIDACNFERNLYLATQLLELKVPLILTLNMVDRAEKQGIRFDTEKIGQFYNARVVSTVGSKGIGIDSLLDTIIEQVEQSSPAAHTDRVHYGDDIEKELEKIIPLVGQEHALVQKYGQRWLSLKLLEQDKEILGEDHSPEVINAVDKSIAHLEKLYGDSPEIVIAEKRYGYISGVYEQAVTRTVQRRHDISDWVDKILLNRVLGLPIFFLAMYLVFQFTFWAGAPFMDMIEVGFEWLSASISGLWPEGSESALRSLIVDGIIGGVGGVVIFLPNIILLFLAIAILEDSGYMARAAFLMDRVMKKIGLDGRSFIPMVIGFGCSIPAIMGTRILDDRKRRFATIMILPLMSCGARMPIYYLIVPAFFENKILYSFRVLFVDSWRWNVTTHALWVFGIYMIGIRKTLLKGKSGMFLMELPPYRMPTVRGLATHMWERSWLYLKKAGTVILAISVVLWALTSFPKVNETDLADLSEEAAQQYELRNSFAGKVGSAMEPVIEPMGFDYRIGTALVGALAAKEVFVAQLGIVYSLGEVDEESISLQDKLEANYTPLQGFCIM